MIKHTSDDENNNNTDVQSRPSDRIDNDEATAIANQNQEEEEEALQIAVINSIRTTPGAFAVTPVEPPRRPTANINITAAAAEGDNDTSRRAPSSAGNSVGAAEAFSSSHADADADGADNNNTTNNSGGEMRIANNYNGHYLPANIDIIAEATLVSSQHEMKEDEGEDEDLVPTEAACELVPTNNDNHRSSSNTGELRGDDSFVVQASTTRGAAAIIDQQLTAADNTIPVVIATAEPMGRMSAVIIICHRHFRLKWWHFVIVVVAIILLVVLPSTLIPRRQTRMKQQKLQDDDDDITTNNNDITSNWMDHSTNLQATIKQILIQNSIISNPATTFHNKSSPQYQALDWMAYQGGVDTILSTSEQQATPYIIQRYILAVLYYSTTGPKWKKQYNFLTNSMTECDWGVGANNGFNVIDCNNDGFVTLINLWQNNLMTFSFLSSLLVVV